jgi:hypothetical protein
LFEGPDFVPGLEILVAALADASLPARTQAMLMRHYKQRGAFAKAEDALFDLLPFTMKPRLTPYSFEPLPH